MSWWLRGDPIITIHVFANCGLPVVGSGPLLKTLLIPFLHKPIFLDYLYFPLEHESCLTGHILYGTFNPFNWIAKTRVCWIISSAHDVVELLAAMVELLDRGQYVEIRDKPGWKRHKPSGPVAKNWSKVTVLRKNYYLWSVPHKKIIVSWCFCHPIPIWHTYSLIFKIRGNTCHFQNSLSLF